MKTRVLLTEQQLRKLIDEEMGVANIVKNESEKIYRLIVDDIAKHKDDFIQDVGFSYYTGSFKYDFLDSELSGRYYIIDYDTKEQFEAFGEESTGGSYLLGRNLFTFNINIVSICGQIVKEEAMDVIQHELEHVYQQTVTKKRFGDIDTNLKVKDNLFKQDPFVREVACLVYGCLRGEQEGHINGMYAYVMAVPEPFSMGLLRRTACYRLYRSMCESYEKLSQDERFDDELKQYNLTRAKIKKNIKLFAERIARTAGKIKLDKTTKQHIRL